MAKLLINNVSLKYHTIEDEIEALREFNLKVTAEEFIGIVGPSGCGKSTLLSLIAGLIKPTTGSIILDGTPISGTTQKLVTCCSKTISLNGAQFWIMRSWGWK